MIPHAADLIPCTVNRVFREKDAPVRIAVFVRAVLRIDVAYAGRPEKKSLKSYP
jgi:hypothetical protein